MAGKDFCPIRRAFESSEHPHLEPPCTLIYLYLDDDELIEEDNRCKKHLEEHICTALGGNYEDSTDTIRERSK